jgi:predicted dinucleotide-binding enzyme
MKIAIIGTGNVGSALGGSLVRAGHEVTFAAVDADKAGQVAASLGARVAPSPVAAAAGADVVVLAVPFSVAEAVAAQIEGAAQGKVIIDTTNPVKADFSGLVTANGLSAAERIAASAPGTHVVKAFNTLFASVQADPNAHGQLVDALYAGDDAGAKETVALLARSIGLRPVDAGTLSGARELEALAWLNISLQLRTGGSWNSSFVLVGAPEGAIAG